MATPTLPPETVGPVLDAQGNRLCARAKVSRLLKMTANGAPLLPAKYLEAMEHNQKISSCCRHPENHEIEAFKSKPEEAAPDIYVFHCTCGKRHTRMCVGAGPRPVWDIR